MDLHVQALENRGEGLIDLSHTVCLRLRNAMTSSGLLIPKLLLAFVSYVHECMCAHCYSKDGSESGTVLPDLNYKYSIVGRHYLSAGISEYVYTRTFFL